MIRTARRICGAVAFSLVGIICSASAFAQSGAMAGRWLVEDIGGQGVLDRVQTTLELTADGAFQGSGGCNTYSGQAKIDGNAITFDRPVSTRKACISAVMGQENKFFKALESVRSWKRDQHGKLLLVDGAGKEIMRLTTMRSQASISFPVPGAEEITTQTLSYRCDETDTRLDVTYINAGSVSLALLSIKDQFVVAANVLSGSGAKYAGAQYIWWTKGETANLYDLMGGEDAAPVDCAEVE